MKRLVIRFTFLWVVIALFFIGSKIVTAQGFWETKAPMPQEERWGAAAVLDGKLHALRSSTLHAVYDAQNDTWSNSAIMPHAASDMAAGVIDGKLYLVGGWPTGNILQVYNPQTDTWSTKAPMPTSRHGLAAGVIDGKLYAVGGVWSNKLEVYDPQTNTWSTKANMPTSRAYPAVGVIDGKLYVVGGGNSDYRSSTIYNKLEVYDPQTNTWSTKAGIPTPRVEVAAGVINGKLYVVGGWTDYPTPPTNKLEVYDPQTDTWSTRADMPTPRASPFVGVINNKLHVASGWLTGGESNFTDVLEVFTETSSPPPIPNYGDVSGDGTISGFDAMLILMHTVSLITLTEDEQEVADVDDNGEITAFDASLVIQRAVGRITEFPVESGQPAAITSISPHEIKLTLLQIVVKPDTPIILPINIKRAKNNLFACELTLDYDASLLKPIRVLPVSATDDFLLQYNKKDNQIRISLASATPIQKKVAEVAETSGLVQIEFEPITQAVITPVRLLHVRLNGQLIQGVVESSIEVLPKKFELLQNYPNPFNPDTWIPYQLAKEAEVVIKIFNVKGELVRTLYVGQKYEGSYTSKEKAALWNGKNNAGESAANGLYFYMLNAGDFQAVRKMMIVK